MGSTTSRTASRAAGGSDAHVSRHSPSTAIPSGSSDTPSTSGPTSARRAGEEPATRAANPSMTPRMSFRRSQRETCTTSGSSAANGPAPPRTADGPPTEGPSRRPIPASSAADARPGHGRVLRRRRVDGGQDDPHVRPGQHRRDERRVREHEGVALVEMRLEECPRLFGEHVDVVRPDVAPPGHPHAVLEQVARQPRRLRVVQEHHVVGADPPVEGVDVGPQDLAVVRRLRGPQRTAVAGGPVQPVVQSLGDGEELRIAVDDDPVARRRPALAAYPTRRRSISATPPPYWVELTFQMVAEPADRTVSTALVWSSARRRAPMKRPREVTERGGTST